MKNKILSALIALTLGMGSAYSQDKPMHEVYSMMVYNFVKYVQWPVDGSEEFVIGVIGNDPMFNTMHKWYTNSKIGLRTVQVKQFKSAADVSNCHVLYLDKARSSEFDALQNKIRGWNTLVITDKNGLGHRGSSINFKVVDSKLRFELNQKAIEASNLKVAGSLSAMAILI